jgi:phosphoserine phosphatase
MQVWAYVGFSESEFRALVQQALERGQHHKTLHHEVLALADWVRAQGRRACIVSASPLWVVEEATRELGFSPKEIAAGVPNTESIDGRLMIKPGMKAPLPYGPDKVVAGRALLKDSKWVAALGDSNFDLDMMAEAQIGIGIGEKESMLAGLAEMSHAGRLHLTL